MMIKRLTFLVTFVTINQLFCNGERILQRLGNRVINSVSSDGADIDPKFKDDLEIHDVETEDGYILTVHRLPGINGSTPVYIQHGLLADSITWLLLGKNKSLPYMLRNAGYDVWLGNVRGNTFGKRHKTLSTSDPKFWDYSWEEHGYYDVPAIINHITNTTNQESIFYIGHSMGTIMFAAFAIDRPEIAQKVKAMIALAPAIYVNNLKGNLKYLPLFRYPIKFFSSLLGANEVFSRSRFWDFLGNTACEFHEIFCAFIIFSIDGPAYKRLDGSSILTDSFKRFPAGTSNKLFDHILQMVESDEFRRYDYGSEKNLEYYGSKNPPVFNVSEIQVPIAAFWAENDQITDKKDIARFYNEIPNKLGLFRVDDDEFNHFAFVADKEAPKLVYSKILQLLGDIKQ